MQKEELLLKFAKIGPVSPRKLLIAHGLFGSGRNWGGIAKALSATHEITVVDMRNHGQSPRNDDMSYFDMAADLAEVIRKQGAPVDVLGHSMGGKAAMVLALQEPDLVNRLVVGDIAPVAYSHSHAGHIDAMAALDLSAVSRRSEADRALAEAVPDRGIRAFLLQSLVFEEGKGRWLLNLPVLREHMSEFVGFPKMDAPFEKPALFVGGAESDYVSAEGRSEIQRLFPRSRVVMLKGAGHWLHADQPEAFAKTVSAFLAV